MKNTKR